MSLPIHDAFTVPFARALVERGSKVLIIDLDMNHGTTRHFGIVPEAFMGSYEMLAGDEEATDLVAVRRKTWRKTWLDGSDECDCIELNENELLPPDGWAEPADLLRLCEHG